jgi:hypothetical protein
MIFSSGTMNPELLRNLRITLPPRRAFFIAATTLALIAISGMLLWNNFQSYYYDSYERQVQDFGAFAYVALMIVLFGLLWVIGPAAAGLSSIQEKLRGTSIFQQMMLLSPLDLATGRLVGSGLFSYFIALFVLPFSFVAAVISGTDFNLVIALYLLLFIGGLACQSIGLFISSTLSDSTEKVLRGGLLVGPVIGFGGAIAAIILSQLFVQCYKYKEVGNWFFYGEKIHLPILLLGLLTFITIWAFIGSIRRIKVSQLIPLSPYTIWIFFASAEFLLLGIFWNSARPYSNPIGWITLYLFFNWIALATLIGSSALSRERLREWWSVGHDPLSVLQRSEIKNALKTFFVALGIAEAGLIALWLGYHMDSPGNPYTLKVFSQLIPIALAFAITVLTVALFAQFCAMHRFRIGGWAGIVLAFIFYIVMAIAGFQFSNKNNSFALINPLIYTDSICERDAYTNYRTSCFTKPQIPAIKTTTIAHGLLAQSLLGLWCFGLAYVKFKKTRRDIFEEKS